MLHLLHVLSLHCFETPILFICRDQYLLNSRYFNPKKAIIRVSCLLFLLHTFAMSMQKKSPTGPHHISERCEESCHLHNSKSSDIYQKFNLIHSLPVLQLKALLSPASSLSASSCQGGAKCSLQPLQERGFGRGSIPRRYHLCLYKG